MSQPSDLPPSAEPSVLPAGGKVADDFTMLPMPARLWVPCAWTPPYAIHDLLEAGTQVRRGDPLVSMPQADELLALAPADGRLAGACQATLTNARPSAVAMIETDSAQPDDCNPAAIPLEFAERRAKALQIWDMPAAVLRLQALGVWADRWLCPDLLGQLRACGRQPVDTVICSLLDVDPTLRVNRACAGAFPVEIVAAVALLGKLTCAKRLWLVVDSAEPPGAWALIREAAARLALELRLITIDVAYPQPDPTLLLYQLTGLRVGYRRLPTERGVLLLDAAAAMAIGQALIGGDPMLRVPLAVHERQGPDDPGRTHLWLAPVGVCIGEVLTHLDLPGPEHLELRAGGPLRDVRLNAGCIVSGGELGIYVTAKEPHINPDPCIRCGWCIEGCPVGAQPAGILQAAQAESLALGRRHGLDACIECGICSYVCPSHLPLLHAIRRLRGEAELKNVE